MKVGSNRKTLDKHNIYLFVYIGNTKSNNLPLHAVTNLFTKEWPNDEVWLISNNANYNIEQVVCVCIKIIEAYMELIAVAASRVVTPNLLNTRAFLILCNILIKRKTRKLWS